MTPARLGVERSETLSTRQRAYPPGRMVIAISVTVLAWLVFGTVLFVALVEQLTK